MSILLSSDHLIKMQEELNNIGTKEAYKLSSIRFFVVA